MSAGSLIRTPPVEGHPNTAHPVLPNSVRLLVFHWVSGQDGLDNFSDVLEERLGS